VSAPDQTEFCAATPASEMTPEGEQMLIPGVRAITLRERLALRLAAPLTASKPQKPLNIGLFDEDARKQLSLF
jgi:hypothetical protein